VRVRRIEKLEKELRPTDPWTRRTPLPELTEEEQDERIGLILLALEEALGLDEMPDVLIANGVAPDVAMAVVEEIRGARLMAGAGDDTEEPHVGAG
jgi:hypothetical protein